MNSFSEAWWVWMVSATCQASVVAFVAVWVSRKDRWWTASLRYWILVLALAKFALPPFWSLPTGIFAALPPAAAPRPVSDHAPVASDRQWSAAAPSESNASPEPGASVPGRRGPYTASEPLARPAGSLGTPRPAWPRIRQSLLLLHFVGMVTVLLWLSRQAWILRGLARNSVLIQSPDNHRPLVEATRALGSRRLPRLLVTLGDATPMAFGIWRPTVLLPVSLFSGLSSDKLRIVLAHELAHLRRGDIWVNWLQCLLLAIWWFNPFFWGLNIALRRTREECCDDLLLDRRVTSEFDYCETLLRSAAELTGGGQSRAAIAFGDRVHPLAHRLQRIMDPTVQRSSRLSLIGILVVALLGGILLPGQSREELTYSVDLLDLQTGIGRPAPVSVPRPISQLVELIRPDPPTLRRSQAALVSELRQYGNVGVEFLLNELRKPELPDDSDHVRSHRAHAIRLLKEFGPAAGLATSALVDALQEENLRLEAVQTLQSIGPTAAPAIPSLLKILNADGPPAAMALVRIAPGSREVASSLASMLQKSDPSDVPVDQLCYALSGLRGNLETVEPALLSVGEGSDHQAASAAAFALQRLGAKSPAARHRIDRWRQQLFDAAHATPRTCSPEDLHRIVAELANATTLHDKYKDAQALTDCCRNLAGDANEGVAGMVRLLRTEKHPGIRSSIVNSLAALGPAARDATPSLVRLLAEDDCSIGLNTIHALGRIGPAARAGIPAIRVFLASVEERERIAAASALWRIDARELRRALPVLMAALQPGSQGEPANWIAAATVLGEIGPPARAAVPRLEAIAANRDDGAHLLALRALVLIEPVRGMKSLDYLMAIVNDTTHPQRALATEIIGRFGRRAARAVPLVASSKLSDDPFLRESAEVALERLGGAAPR